MSYINLLQSGGSANNVAVLSTKEKETMFDELIAKIKVAITGIVVDNKEDCYWIVKPNGSNKCMFKEGSKTPKKQNSGPDYSYMAAQTVAWEGYSCTYNSSNGSWVVKRFTPMSYITPLQSGGSANNVAVLSTKENVAVLSTKEKETMFDELIAKIKVAITGIVVDNKEDCYWIVKPNGSNKCMFKEGSKTPKRQYSGPDYSYMAAQTVAWEGYSCTYNSSNGSWVVKRD